MDLGLAGKNAIITGSSRGLGLASARAMVRAQDTAQNSLRKRLMSTVFSHEKGECTYEIRPRRW